MDLGRGQQGGYGKGGGWHKASVSDCSPLAGPVGLSPLLILTLCGPERVLVVSGGGSGRYWKGGRGGGGSGRYWKGERGGGIWDPKVCVPKMTRQDVPNGKFRFFPRRSLWSGGAAPLLLRCTALLIVM